MFKLNNLTRLLVLASLFLAFGAYAQSQNVNRIESDWISANKGSKERRLGAEVVSVENDQSRHRVSVSVPSMASKDVEEVIVIGRAPDNSETVLEEASVEILKDFKNGRSGIVITLNKRAPFRILINYVEY